MLTSIRGLARRIATDHRRACRGPPFAQDEAAAPAQSPCPAASRWCPTTASAASRCRAAIRRSRAESPSPTTAGSTSAPGLRRSTMAGPISTAMSRSTCSAAGAATSPKASGSMSGCCTTPIPQREGRRCRILRALRDRYRANSGPVHAKLGVNYAWDQKSLGGDDNLYIHTELSSGIPKTPLTLSAHLGYTDGVARPADACRHGRRFRLRLVGRRERDRAGQPDSRRIVCRASKVRRSTGSPTMRWCSRSARASDESGPERPIGRPRRRLSFDSLQSTDVPVRRRSEASTFRSTMPMAKYLHSMIRVADPDATVGVLRT